MQDKITLAIDALASAALLEGGVSPENTQATRELTEQRKRELVAAICTPCLHKIQEPAPAQVVQTAPQIKLSAAVRGVGVVDDCDTALAVYFTAVPRKEDIRALHDALTKESSPQAAPALEAPAALSDAEIISAQELHYQAKLEAGQETVCTCPSGDGSLRWPCPTHPPERAMPAVPTPELQRMTAGRATYFMERFLREEKLLGPNEQAALRFVINMLEAPAAPAGEVVYRWQALDFSGYCYGSNPPEDPPARCNLTPFYRQPDAYRTALHEISATGNLTATGQQFARHLQQIARDALAAAPQVPAPAQAATPAAVKRQFTDGTRTLRQDCISAIRDFAGSKPEDGEDWESWFEAAFDLLGSRVNAVFDEHSTTAEKSNSVEFDGIKTAAPVVLPEPDAWLAVYEDREGNSKFYTSTHKDLAVENDTNGKPQPLYTEQKVRALLDVATGNSGSKDNALLAQAATATGLPAQPKRQVFVLTVNQMRQAIEFATGGFTPDTQDELEASLSFSVGPVQDDDGKIVADGVYCWLTELAEEGALPLDECPTESDIAALSAPQVQADARDAESDYQRGYRHGYNRRDAEVQGALL